MTSHTSTRAPGSPGSPLKLGVLISGGGTSLLNMVEVIARGELSAQIVQVISSRADCRGVERAQAAGLPCQAISPRAYPDSEAFSQAVFATLREAGVDLVVLAGFLSLLPIPPDFANRVLNIHPSLIPAFCGPGFYGHRVHEAVLKRGCKLSGCTVHFADNAYDHGPIIAQQAVEVLPDDTAATLAARVFLAECQLYPQVIGWYGAGRLQLEGATVRILPHRDEPGQGQVGSPPGVSG
ncbi:MAG: phosphoribosylglycinamide formyltransferase [Planctomycetaceae bacterium]